ncbi:LiaF domain-containing protein [Chloroflexota bacterium]
MFHFSILGNTKVKGKYKPDQKNMYATLLGNHELDLRQAELLSDTPIKITICALIGRAKVIVPSNISVDVGGMVVIGDRKTNVDDGTESPRAHLRISFNCIVGRLEVTSNKD